MVSNLLSDSIKHNLIDKFNDLTEYALSNSQFYSKLYGKVAPKINQLEEIKMLPYTLRESLQEYYPFGYLCKNRSELIAYFETSGSTGNPIPVFPDMSIEKAQSFAQFLDYWMRLKNSRVNLAIVALPYEMNPMGLKYHMALSALGITVIPTSVRTTLCPPKKLISLIRDLKPGLIIGRPMEIMRYAEGMLAMGLNPAECSIRKIFITGETMSTAKWKRIEDLYGGAEIYSTYGLTELDTGLISCSHHHYHLPNSSNLIIELVNENGEYVSEGEPGEVIITNLDKNFAPLIRYKTGDIAEFHTHCDCEDYDTPYLILHGRKVDKKIIASQAVFPRDIEDVIYKESLAGCEYQLVVNDGKLRIKLEKSYYNNESSSEYLEKRIGESLRANGIEADIEVMGFNELADKFGIAKMKACRFFDITGLDAQKTEKALKINICDGRDFLDN